MKKYLLISMALLTPQILCADQSTELSSTKSLRQVKTTTQANQDFTAIDIVINRIQSNPKLSKSFKEVCMNCGEGTLSSFKARALSPEQMNQVANAVKAFGQQNSIAPELKYFPKN